MIFVASLFLIALLMIAWRFRPTLTLAHGLLAVIVLGSVFGHPFFHVSAGGIPITLDRLFLAGLVSLTGFLLMTKRLAWAPWNRIDLCLLAFVGLLIINVFSSDWKYRDNQPLAQLLFNYFVPLGIYFVARNLGNDPRAFRVFNWGLMGLGAYLALIAICEVKGWYGLIFPKFIINAEETEFLGRGRGPFLNPIACGMYQMMALCCGMVWWGRANTTQKAWLVAFAGLMLTGIFCTLTRSVWLATGMVLAIYVWRQAGQTWRGIFLVAAPVAAVVLLFLVGDRINSFKRDKEVTAEEMSESIELRPLLAIVAGRMIEEKPLFGHGLRQYSKYRAHYTIKSEADRPLQKVLPYVQHNLFLSYAVDIGLIGLGIYLLALGSWFWIAIKLWWHPQLPWDVQRSAYLLLAFLVGFCVNGMFHDVSVIVMLHPLLFLLVGWVSAENRYFFAAEEKLPEPAADRNSFLPVSA